MMQLVVIKKITCDRRARMAAKSVPRRAAKPFMRDIAITAAASLLRGSDNGVAVGGAERVTYSVNVQRERPVQRGAGWHMVPTS
jgi:hypothetical protein